MAVGLSEPSGLLPITGIKLAAGACGVKASGEKDLLIITADENTQSAAVFTQNAYCAAPVTVAKEHMEEATSRALIINSGNANAGTGTQGHSDAVALCKSVADELGLSTQQVLPFSTGVIGELLPVPLIQQGIEQLQVQLLEDNWLAAAEAIMTTDTVAKGYSAQCTIDGELVSITGIAKGSGMIHPDMATMLAYVATDAAVDPYSLQQAIGSIADASFNSISVDGDTSTNDAFVVLATAQCGNRLLSPSHPEWDVFLQALNLVAIYLAQAIIRDGEGATRFIEIQINGGASIEDCRKAGFTVAHSPLVKTAFFAGDPNLGRILAAVGRSKVADLDMQKVSLWIGSLPVVENGEPSSEYNEEQAAGIMAAEDIVITIDLGMGEHQTTLWTTDLTYDYVKINAEYRS